MCQKKAAARKQKGPNRCWFHDIATVNTPESSDIMVTYPVWHIIADKASVTNISGFYMSENVMLKLMCERIHNMREKE